MGGREISVVNVLSPFTTALTDAHKTRQLKHSGKLCLCVRMMSSKLQCTTPPALARSPECYTHIHTIVSHKRKLLPAKETQAQVLVKLRGMWSKPK